MTSGGLPGVETRLVRCDPCGHPFLVTYRRLDTARALMSNIVTSVWVQCPTAACQSRQQALVPIDAYAVSSAAWLGSAEAARHRHTLGEIMRATPPDSDASQQAERSCVQTQARVAFVSELAEDLSTPHSHQMQLMVPGGVTFRQLDGACAFAHRLHS